jgi:Trk K+ transport system NAD-binding subunit
VIDPRAEEVEGDARVIAGPANADTLEQAGVDHAAGVVAATDSDYDNLGVLMAVKAMKPDAFTIARQNNHDHQIAFDAANADLVLQSSLTTARRVLKHLISPHVQVFVEYLRAQGEDICGQTVERIKATIDDNMPHLWQVRICEAEASAVTDHLRKQKSLTLGEMRRDPHDLDGFVEGIPLSIARNDEHLMLPGDDQPLREGDQILFCGTEHGELMLAASMNNIYTLDYLITGVDRPRGYLFQWLDARLRRSAGAA